MIELYKFNEYSEYKLGEDTHRANGPAILWNDGQWDWYLYDAWHRYYGPQSSDGNWYIHDDIIKGIL